MLKKCSMVSMEKKSLIKILLYVLSLLLVLSLMGLYFIMKYVPDESVLCINGEPLIPMTKQSAKSRTDNASSYSYLYFRFTDNQRAKLENLIYSNNGEAVKILINLLDKDDNSPFNFAYGFLYEEDFKDKKHLRQSFSVPSLVTGELKDGEKALELSLCIRPGSLTDDTVPYGFVVYGTKNYSVESVSFVSPVLGWSKKESVKYYAFGSGGGSINDIGDSFDFSEGEVYFSRYIDRHVYPEITISFYPVSDIGSYNNQSRVNFDYCGEKLGIRRSFAFTDFSIPVSGLKNSYGVFNITGNADMVSSLLMTGPSKDLLATEEGDVLTPVSVDLGMILSYPEEHWRSCDYGLYVWQEFPHILFFDFADYKIQNSFFTRLAYFVEKQGYKGTLVSDYYVDNMHGYNAHDYKAVDLAAFFTKARKENFKLNDKEELLCRILVKNGIIIEEKDGNYREGKGAVISISRESLNYIRATLIAHESWHGIYFLDEEFRNTVAAVYYMFDEVSMDFLKTYWHTQPTLAYDINDEYLMQNEFMAYILQQSLSNIKNYYLLRTSWNSVLANEAEQSMYVKNTDAQAFYDACAVLNDYVFERWGFAAGRVSLFIRY